MQADNFRENGFTPVPPLRVLRHDPRSDLHFLPDPQDASEDRATGHAALEFVDFGAGLVDVEGTDDDEAWF
jgi:hypothetical protein